jgi:membrane protein DedA with SNARE-associated domain
MRARRYRIHRTDTSYTGRVTSLTSLLEHYGLAILFVAVAMESAGVPIPGETALITAAFLARPEYGTFSLTWVIVVAAAAAIVGDNIGYWLGRIGGRPLLERWSFTSRHTERVLPPAERFFERHGPKTVFFARFVALLRVTAAWIAGMSHMEWRKFLFWNAAGGIVWAVGISLLAFWAGKAVAEAVNRYGLYAVLALIALAIAGFFAFRYWNRRLEKNLER